MAQEEGAGQGQYRQLGGVTGTVVRLIAVAFMLYSLLQLSGVFSRLRIYIDTIPYLASHLAFGLSLAFLLVPATKNAPKNRLPWYDALLAMLVAAQPLYVFFRFGEIQLHLAMARIAPYEFVMTMIMMLLVLEVGRRTIGLAMPTITVFFILYALSSSYFPGIMRAPNYDLTDLARNLGMWSGGFYGRITAVSATIVVMFVLLAHFLIASGAARFFINLALSLAGRWRGGPAKVAVLGSALVGTVEGSASANVVTVGLITIPLMKSMGYRPHYAGAIEAAASTGGQIMPPVMGIAAFIMADFLRVSYSTVMVAAVVPAILYFAAVLIQVHLQAVKTGMKAMPREQLPSVKRTLLHGYQFLGPLLVLLYLMLGLGFTPQLSAIYAIIVLVVVALFRKETRMGPKAIIQALDGGAKGMLSIIGVIAMAGIIIGCVELTGLGVRFTSAMALLAGGNVLLLLTLAAVACFILGMGLPTSACYILLAIIVAPGLVALGVIPMAAHMFIFYWGLSAMVTPPVCVAAFVAAAIAGAEPMKTGWQATRLSLAAYIVPFAFIFDPSLLLMGSVTQILIAAATALVAIFALSASIEAYLLTNANAIQRVLLATGGIFLIAPGLVFDVTGVSLVLIAAFWQLISWRALCRREQAETAGTSLHYVRKQSGR